MDNPLNRFQEEESVIFATNQHSPFFLGTVVLIYIVIRI